MKRINTDDKEAMTSSILAYGEADAPLEDVIGTLPADETYLISSYHNISGLSGSGLTGVVVDSLEELREVREHVTHSESMKHYKYLAIIGLTEMANIHLALLMKEGEAADSKKTSWDAYAKLANAMRSEIRLFNSIKNTSTYWTVQQEMIQDEKGRQYFSPGMPGRALPQQMCYWFSNVFCLREVELGVGESAESKYMFQTKRCKSYQAFCSQTPEGNPFLGGFEDPNLSIIMAKLKGGSSN